MTLERITHDLREVCVGCIERESIHTRNKTERLWFSHLLEGEPACGCGEAAEDVRVSGSTRLRVCESVRTVMQSPWTHPILGRGDTIFAGFAERACSSTVRSIAPEIRGI